MRVLNEAMCDITTATKITLWRQEKINIHKSHILKQVGVMDVRTMVLRTKRNFLILMKSIHFDAKTCSDLLHQVLENY